MDHLELLKEALDYTRAQGTVTQQFESFMLAAALKIWSAGEYSETYQQAIMALTGRYYSAASVATAMDCCREEGRRLAWPRWLADAAADDVAHGTENAISMLKSCYQVLTGLTRVDGTEDPQKQAALEEVLDELRACCLEQGLTGLPEWDSAQWTRPASPAPKYSPPPKPKPEKKEPRSPKAPEPENEEPLQPINLIINLGGSCSSGACGTEEEPAPAAAAPVAERSEETLESLLEELDSLVGLTTVKQDVHSLMNFIKVAQVREKRGMKVPVISYHLVFTGNPGTGKTTVARLVAKLYHQIGILPKGQLVETDRSGLVAGYLGQTAIKTQKVIQSALGGVLFIDEAYALAGENNDSYGTEAVETLLKAMEDHRNELVVIVAGYDELMHQFINSNPGLASRFSKYIHFPDYDGRDLLLIFKRFCDSNGYRLAPEAEQLLEVRLAQLYETREEHFGNARTVRNIFEKAINVQADRLACLSYMSDSDLELLTGADLEAALKGV